MYDYTATHVSGRSWPIYAFSIRYYMERIESGEITITRKERDPMGEKTNGDPYAGIGMSAAEVRKSQVGSTFAVVSSQLEAVFGKIRLAISDHPDARLVLVDTDALCERAQEVLKARGFSVEYSATKTRDFPNAYYMIGW